MSGQSFVDQLQQKFGNKVTGANLENIDPWIEVAPEGIIEVCTYLRDEPSLAFDYLNDISAVDYLHIDEKKAAKVDWEPHLEVVYHLFSMKHKHSLVLKVMLPCSLAFLVQVKLHFLQILIVSLSVTTSTVGQKVLYLTSKVVVTRKQLT